LLAGYRVISDERKFPDVSARRVGGSFSVFIPTQTYKAKEVKAALQVQVIQGKVN
jgi:hypothetical protein